MNRVLRALVFVLASTVALPAAADELSSLSADFWAWRAAQQPYNGDDIPRLERPEGVARDWSRTAVDRMRADLTRFEERWKRIDPAGMPPAWQVDRRLVASALARVRWELDVLRAWERNPLFYVDQALVPVCEAMLQPPPFSRARAVELVHRLQAVAGLVGNAKANLEGRAIGPFARAAIASLQDIRPKLSGSAAALRLQLPEPARGGLDSAAASAAKALEDFRQWLEVRVATMPTNTAVGREGYVFFLRKVALLPSTPEELLAMGREEWSRAVTLQTLEENRGAGQPEPSLPLDEAAQAARLERDESAVRRFLEARNILTVPPWMKHYRNRPLPPYLAPLASVTQPDDLTGPSRLADDATSYIPKPSPELPFFDLATARDSRPILVHEGVPGHYFQLALSWAHEDPIRRHYYDSGPNEGIGFYAEEMMLSAGYFDDSPKTRETIAAFLRLRALRVEADVKLATGQFTIDQAADYLEKTVPMDRETAREEATSFAAGPGQGITYLVGKLQIQRLLAEARRAQGPKFSLRAFHDSIWKNGNVPLSLQRYELLGSTDELDRLDASR